MQNLADLIDLSTDELTSWLEEAFGGTARIFGTDRVINGLKFESVDCRCGLKAEVVELLPGIWHVVCKCGKVTKECASENDARKEWMK